MDSKLRGRAILVSLSAILLIAMLVVYGNLDARKDRGGLPSGEGQTAAGPDGVELARGSLDRARTVPERNRRKTARGQAVRLGIPPAQAAGEMVQFRKADRRSWGTTCPLS